MLYKKREKSCKLLIMESLISRTDYSKEDYDECQKQVKGYEGECYFDTLIAGLTCDCLVLNDLLLEIHGTEFQIDVLVITAREILLYEVKNYGGEYLHKEGFLVSIPSGNSFHSPTERINRHTSLLQSLLEIHHLKMPIEPFVAFVHPEFMLYDTSTIQKVLMRATFPKHFRKLNTQSDSLSKRHYLLADKLCELSFQTNRYLKGVPEYTYETCKKGIICSECRQFISKIAPKSKTCTCLVCGNIERVSATISRHTLEYKRLFPERKVTVSNIYDWCGGVCPVRRIRSVLQKEYKPASVGRALHYV